MSANSKIEWTDATWNPVRGCTKVSHGCKNCYAETFSERFRGVHGHPFEYGFDLRLVPEKLTEPTAWKRPRKIFVNSMSDIFHEGVPDEYIYKCFTVMAEADWHIYQVLTKRPSRMKKMFDGVLSEFSGLKHIWLGVSVENRRQGMPRVLKLQETKCSVRFLSVEPLLEDIGTIDLGGIHWVIVGGESGPRARPMDKKWVISIRRQCRAQKVPFFFKQWGGVIKSKTGRALEGRFYNEMPQIFSVPAGA